MGLVAPQYVGSSCTRDQTHVSCAGSWILYHWATREALPVPILTFWNLEARDVSPQADQPHVSSWLNPGRNQSMTSSRTKSAKSLLLNMRSCIWLCRVLAVACTRAALQLCTWAPWCGLSSRGAQAQLPWGMWNLSPWTRNWICVPYIARSILNHWVTREVPQNAKCLSTSSVFYLPALSHPRPLTLSLHHWVQGEDFSLIRVIFLLVDSYTLLWRLSGFWILIISASIFALSPSFVWSL